MEIFPLQPEHWPLVKNIYEEGMATGQATFETSAPTWEEWNAAHLPVGRIICVEGNEIVGWASLSKMSERCVYDGVAEASVYVKASARGKGVGKFLLEKLIQETENNNIWTIHAGIFPENTASISLFEKGGFRKIGYREKIGMMNGVWRDTVMFERRSRKVGIT